MNKALLIAASFSLALVSSTAIAQYPTVNSTCNCCGAARVITQRPVTYRPVTTATYQSTNQTACNGCNVVPHQGSLPAPTLVQRPVVVYRPLVKVAPQPHSYIYGRGIIGQPKVYVPGQPVRNFFRYLSP